MKKRFIKQFKISFNIFGFLYNHITKSAYESHEESPGNDAFFA